MRDERSPSYMGTSNLFTSKLRILGDPLRELRSQMEYEAFGSSQQWKRHSADETASDMNVSSTHGWLSRWLAKGGS
jgi:hypothetical protein